MPAAISVSQFWPELAMAAVRMVACVCEGQLTPENCDEASPIGVDVARRRASAAANRVLPANLPYTGTEGSAYVRVWNFFGGRACCFGCGDG